MTVVLDASAILAWLNGEPGGGAVRAALPDSIVSAVNWAEVLQKAEQLGSEPGAIEELATSFGIEVVDATRTDAIVAAKLWEPGTSLSLGDRFCLALGFLQDMPVLTTDRIWADLDTGSEVVVVR